jgi:predicted nucleic acid-binding protein
MADCLIDANIVSYLLRGDTRAQPYRTDLADKESIISFMTLAELRHWGMARQWGAQRYRDLEILLDGVVVTYADDDLCRTWATVVTERERIGRPIDTADAWVAAPAWLLGIPLVTHNARHFADIAGLQVISFGGTDHRSL